MTRRMAQWIGFLVLVPVIASCGGGGGGSSPDTGSGGKPSVAAKTSVVAPGDADCPAGGILVETGIDENGNGVLDASEVDVSEKVCNGGTTLVDMNPEPAGVNCPMGGLRIDSGVDGNGNGSLDPDEITQTGFVCNGGDGSIGWQVPALLELGSAGDASDSQVVVDSNGYATAVWKQPQFNGAPDSVYSSRYVPGVGWGEVQLVETDESGRAWYPKVAVDPGGTVVAVWYQFDGSNYNIWANHYVPGFGWSMPQAIDNVSGSAYRPQVAVDDSGNAIVVWYQYDGSRFNIYSNRYVSGTGWEGAQLIETDDTGDASYPQVAMDGNGTAVVVWSQFDGTRNSIWSNRYVPGTDWEGAQLIEANDAGNAMNPRVAMDDSGNAVAVWELYDGTLYHVWSNRYVSGTGWGTAELIETEDAMNALSPQVAMDGSGNAVAVWRLADGTRYNLWSKRYVPGTGWEAPQLIETDNTSGVQSPQVAMDGNGNAVVVWTNYGRLWSNRYVLGAGWGTAQLVETDNTGSAHNPSVAMDGNGNAVVAWEQYDGTMYNLWSNRWQAP